MNEEVVANMAVRWSAAIAEHGRAAELAMQALHDAWQAAMQSGEEASETASNLGTAMQSFGEPAEAPTEG